MCNCIDRINQASRCQTCGSDNDGDKLWSDRYCQECWEAYCSQEWWNMLAKVDKEILSLD